ncbi:MAG: DUF2188 domain-containing protein [Gemmatimonadota bacterium]
MANKTKIIAGVAAAAATTGFAVLAARKRAAPDVVYHVTADGDGWSVTSEGAKRALSRHPTKQQAVSAARDVAHANAPSRLVIHKQDGAVQRTHEYQPS